MTRSLRPVRPSEEHSWRPALAAATGLEKVVKPKMHAGQNNFPDRECVWAACGQTGVLASSRRSKRRPRGVGSASMPGQSNALTAALFAHGLPEGTELFELGAAMANGVEHGVERRNVIESIDGRLGVVRRR